MAITIRLTPQIESLAKTYCERVGISLNSLVGVALDAYLQRPEPVPVSAPIALQPEPVAVAEAPPPSPAPAAVEPVQRHFEPREKPVLTAPPWRPSEPKPVLGPNPSKAERSKLADWYRRNPAK
jgi:hypothetical protein